MPVLAPPPKSPIQSAIYDTGPRLNPFDHQNDIVSSAVDQHGGLPSGNYCYVYTKFHYGFILYSYFIVCQKQLNGTIFLYNN